METHVLQEYAPDEAITAHHRALQRIRRHHRALQDILQCITRHHSAPQRSTTQYKAPRVSKETSGVFIWRPAAACSRCCLEATDLTYASNTCTGNGQRLFPQCRKPAPYTSTSRRAHGEASQRAREPTDPGRNVTKSQKYRGREIFQIFL